MADLSSYIPSNPPAPGGKDYPAKILALINALGNRADPFASANTLQNLSLPPFTVNAGAATLTVKTRDGSTPTALNPIAAALRSATLGNGDFTVPLITGALSIVVTSGATLGTVNGVGSWMYAYLINNAGALELAVSSKYFGDSGIVSTTIMNNAADSATEMYSTTARANVPFRIIGRQFSMQGAAGTWASVPTIVKLGAPEMLGMGIQGSTLSNNVADATNDIDIAAGACADATLATWMVGGAMTKRLDANWVVGTNQGMLDTGAVANGTYHIFRIMRSDTGGADILASLSATSPTMPANYDFKRRIGSIVRVSAAIKAFLQTGDRFEWKTPLVDVSGAAAALAPTNRTLTVPMGIKVEALLGLTAVATSTSNQFTYDPDLGALQASAINRTIYVPNTTLSASLQCMTSSSAQVGTSADGTGATITICTFGWVDQSRSAA